MRSRRIDKSVERLRHSHDVDFKPLARMAARWSIDNQNELSDADPDVPQNLHDRAADNWRPLIAIADLAGGEWPARARRTAIKLSAEEQGKSARTQLLSDIREILGDRDKITSSELVTRLVDTGNL